LAAENVKNYSKVRGSHAKKYALGNRVKDGKISIFGNIF
jgi:hypothetical protein